MREEADGSLYMLLALLKCPLSPRFIFNNGMNLVSKLLTILTLALELIIFCICTNVLEDNRFCRFLANFGACDDEARDQALTRRKD